MSDRDYKILGGKAVPLGRRATALEGETLLDTLSALFAERTALEARQAEIRQRLDELVTAHPDLKAVARVDVTATTDGHSEPFEVPGAGTDEDDDA
jgi:hypothetical protein